MNKDDNKIVLLPDYLDLQNELETLQEELVALVLERDQLYVVCENIEQIYLMRLGALEYRQYELYCRHLRLKRKTTLIQASKNRQECIEEKTIERQLDQEFLAYRRQLSGKMENINKALRRQHLRTLTDEEMARLKHLYRHIVKVLHPDINAHLTPVKRDLFNHAVQAYRAGDLASMETITLLLDSHGKPQKPNTLREVKKACERMKRHIAVLNEEIAEIKQRYPYTQLALVEDDVEISKKEHELRESIRSYEEAIKTKEERIRQMIGDSCE